MRYICFILCFVVYLFAGCGVSSLFEETKTVSFKLPEMQKNSALQVEYWKVHAESAEESRSFKVSADSRNFELELKSNELCSVTAVPVVKINGKELYEDFFKPAGAVYPYSKKLDWLEGFTAEILYESISHKKQNEENPENIEAFLEQFNWNKFSESLENKCGEQSGNYDPNLLDSDEILEKIDEKDFSVSLLTQSGTVDVSGFEIAEKKFDLENAEVVLFSEYFPESFAVEEDRTVLLKKNVQKKFVIADGKKAFLVFASDNGSSKNHLALNFFTL